MRIVGVVGTRLVIAVCLFMAVSVAASAWRNLWAAARSTAVDGTVVRQAESWAADWDTGPPRSGETVALAPARRLFRAVVQYRAGGAVYEVMAHDAVPAPAYPTGSTHAVVYPPGRPDLGQLRSELPDVWGQAALLLMGTIVGTGAVRWWWRLRRHQTIRRGPRVRAMPDAAPLGVNRVEPDGVASVPSVGTAHPDDGGISPVRDTTSGH